MIMVQYLRLTALMLTQKIQVITYQICLTAMLKNLRQIRIGLSLHSTRKMTKRPTVQQVQQAQEFWQHRNKVQRHITNSYRQL